MYILLTLNILDKYIGINLLYTSFFMLYFTTWNNKLSCINCKYICVIGFCQVSRAGILFAFQTSLHYMRVITGVECILPIRSGKARIRGKTRRTLALKAWSSRPVPWTLNIEYYFCLFIYLFLQFKILGGFVRDNLSCYIYLYAYVQGLCPEIFVKAFLTEAHFCVCVCVFVV